MDYHKKCALGWFLLSIPMAGLGLLEGGLVCPTYQALRECKASVPASLLLTVPATVGSAGMLGLSIFFGASGVMLWNENKRLLKSLSERPKSSDPSRSRIKILT